MLKLMIRLHDGSFFCREQQLTVDEEAILQMNNEKDTFGLIRPVLRELCNHSLTTKDKCYCSSCNTVMVALGPSPLNVKSIHGTMILTGQSLMCCTRCNPVLNIMVSELVK